MKIKTFGMVENGGKWDVSVELVADSQLEALGTLAKLGVVEVAGWNLSGQSSAKDDAPVAKPKTADMASVLDEEEAKATKVAAKPIAPKPVKAAPPPVEDDDEDEDDEEDDEDEEEASEPEAAPQRVKITGDDIKLLKDAKKLRDVLDHLINKKGIKSKKGLIAACSAIKDKVPALARIEDLEDRIPGAVELLDPTIK